MSELTPRDLELVALGAALGSNCVPCIEHHIPESRRAGLSDPEIQAAIQHADRIRQVPARKTLQAALNMLPPGADAEASQTTQPRDMMMAMMSQAMGACGSHGRPGGAPDPAGKMPAGRPASGGCECG